MNNTDYKMIANRLDEIHAMIHEINLKLDIIKSNAPIESKKANFADVLSDLDKQISSTMYKNTITA